MSKLGGQPQLPSDRYLQLYETLRFIDKQMG